MTSEEWATNSRICVTCPCDPLELIAYYGCHDFSFASIVSELAEIDALPCAEVETAFGDRYAETDATECALGMGWHIIGTFQNMVVVRFVFLNESVEYLLHIRADIGIGILVDAQRTAGVLYEKVEKTCLWQLGKMTEYLPCDEVKSATLGR